MGWDVPTGVQVPFIQSSTAWDLPTFRVGHTIGSLTAETDGLNDWGFSKWVTWLSTWQDAVGRRGLGLLIVILLSVNCSAKHL